MTPVSYSSAAVDIWAATSAIATGAAAVIAAALAFWQARIAIGARNATVERATVARETPASAAAQVTVLVTDATTTITASPGVNR
jgi:hypothetical protein